MFDKTDDKIYIYIYIRRKSKVIFRKQFLLKKIFMNQWKINKTVIDRFFCFTDKNFFFVQKKKTKKT